MSGSPERDLWMAVLHRATLDATQPVRDVRHDGARRTARVWIERGGNDFRKACELAGVEPEWVQRRLRDANVKVRA